MKVDFSKMGLVLEGGGMRGVFTCGVLDFMMDNNIEFPYGVGVSAGACNGLSYMSHQRGRARFSNIDMLEKYNYISFKHLFHQRSILDQKLLYELFPEEILPYDYDAYMKNPNRFEMVTTNCVTGRRPMLDGGIIDSIPVMRAIEQGYDKNVVVLTRNRGYRKTERDIKVPSFIYSRYPRLRVLLSNRCRVYNEQLEMIEKMEDEGRIIAIRPEKKVVVNRIEKDIKKLTELYEEGYICAEKVLKPLMQD